MKGSKNPPVPEHYLAHARQLRSVQTDVEQLMWSLLRGRRLAGCKFRRQVPVAGYVLDFYCHEIGLAVELDGSQHMAALEYDRTRAVELAAQGIEVLRFWNHQVLAETEAVLMTIWYAIEGRRSSPHPGPLPEGEGDKRFVI